MELLGHARQRGYPNATQMTSLKVDADWDPLRDREDLRQLLQELEEMDKQ